MANQAEAEGAGLGLLARAVKGAAHPARLRLLGMLARGELCVCQMTAVLGLAASTVSRHLSVLRRGGLVEERRQGRLAFYRMRAGGPEASWLVPLLRRLASDPLARADRVTVARLRRIPVSILCAADLDLEAAGARRAGRGRRGRRRA